MNPFDSIMKRAKNDPRHIVLAEGGNVRVLEGAVSAVEAGIARITLLGRKARIRRQLQERDLPDPPFNIVDPTNSFNLGIGKSSKQKQVQAEAALACQ